VQQRTDRIIAVKRKPEAVRDQNKKQIQQQLFLPQRGQETIGEKTVRDKAKTPINAPDPAGIENFLLYHGQFAFIFWLTVASTGKFIHNDTQTFAKMTAWAFLKVQKVIPNTP